MTTDIVKTNHSEVPCITFGSGARPLVILPGLGLQPITASAEAIAAAYRVFEQAYTVYVIDRSLTLPVPCTVRGMAADTAAVMRCLGISQADVFGASLGGMVAQYLAIDYPELVHALVLGSTLSRPNETALQVADEWSGCAESGDVTKLYESLFKRLYCEETVKLFRGVPAFLGENITEEMLARFSNQAKAILRFNAYAELGGISCPTLVIGVEGDKVVTAQASREIAEAIGCQLYLYGREYGHCVFDEAPDYRERLLTFFRSHKTF